MIASPKSFPPEQVAKYPTVLCWYLSDFLGVLIFFFFKSHMVRMFGNVRKDLFFLSLTAKHDRPRACCRLGTHSFFVLVRWQRVDKMKVRNSYKWGNRGKVRKKTCAKIRAIRKSFAWPSFVDLRQSEACELHSLPHAGEYGVFNNCTVASWRKG